MNSLVKSIIQPILEQEGQNIALVPGGFKPPTVGHFSLVNEVAKNPNIDKVIVLIGHKNRDGVSKEESLDIWNIYKKYLPSNVEIKISDSSSPVADVGSLIKNNPQTMFYPVVGIRGEMDLGDLKRFDSLKDKYDNFKTIVIKSDETENRISGTNTRAALIGGEKDRFLTYLPTELTDKEKNEIWSILTKTPIEEVKYAEPSKFDYPPMIKSLTEYMLDKGMNIRPLPKVKFVDDDVENAQNFFGKTAYYDPTNKIVVLYTMNRHPKDVMRSFAHEMIHHEQNCNGKLQNITTQNTNEEGDLPEIEREAYEKGNMTFRNWTDTLTEGILSEGRYDKISNTISSDIFNKWKQDFDNGLPEGKYVNNYASNGFEFKVDATLKFLDEGESLKIDGGLEENENENIIYFDFEVDKNILPGMWSEISMNLKDVARHEIEHLTQSDLESYPSKYMESDQLIRDLINAELLSPAQYFKLEKEIDANLQGMYFRAKKEKRPFKDVIDSYLDAQDITPEQKEEILDLWRQRVEALSLPLFENGIMSKEQLYIQEYKEYALKELFEKDLSNIEKISPTEYLIDNGNDIEAKYFFKLEIPEKNIWSVNWEFTPNNQNTTPEAWKQVTATSFKILKDFIQEKNPTSLHISGNTNVKTKLYKNYITKLETLLNNQYKIDNSDEYSVILRSIEELSQPMIQKRMETLNESYEQAFNYCQNGDLNSKSKIERWESSKKLIKRTILEKLYNIK
jgi:phosphopantetheine adenylyltransferase